MKILFLVILVLCISAIESQKKKGKGVDPRKKNICQKDIRFLVSVMRVCNAYKRASRFRMKNWDSLRKYIRYALFKALKKGKKPPPKGKKPPPKDKKPPPKGKDDKKKESRSYRGEDISLDDVDTGSFDDDEYSWSIHDDNSSNNFDDEDAGDGLDDEDAGDGLDDEDAVEDDSESDPPSKPTDTEAEIQALRRYLKLSGRDRHERAAKRKRKKDPFRSLRILCYKMSRLMNKG